MYNEASCRLSNTILFAIRHDIGPTEFSDSESGEQNVRGKTTPGPRVRLPRRLCKQTSHWGLLGREWIFAFVSDFTSFCSFFCGDFSYMVPSSLSLFSLSTCFFRLVVVVVVATRSSQLYSKSQESAMNLRLSSLLILAACLWGTVQADSTFATAPSSDTTFFRGGATRAAWGAQPAKQKITVRTTPRQQQQQQKKETKEAMDAFLTRDSRTTFIGTYTKG